MKAAREMLTIDTVLVKLASRCNLNCDYCYVYNMGDDAWRLQPKLMSSDTVGALAHGLAGLIEAQEHPLSVVFHGGEPLLIGAARFDAVCHAMRAAVGSRGGLHVQTNGVLLTDEVIEVCARHDVGISVSMDGIGAVHDAHRPDRRGRGSHAAVIAALERLMRHDLSARLFSGLLAVIDLKADPAATYEALKATGTPSVDFLYRDGNHADLPVGKSSVTSTEYGRWMERLLQTYLADHRPIRVRVLDDMMRLILGGRSVKEGVGDQSYGILVVDTDGTVTKNDTLKSVAGADRFAERWSVYDGLTDLVASADFQTYHEQQRPSAARCRACPHLRVCGGGMPAHRWSAARGFDNPSVYCDDQILLIDAMNRALGVRAAA